MLPISLGALLSVSSSQTKNTLVPDVAICGSTELDADSERFPSECDVGVDTLTLAAEISVIGIDELSNITDMKIIKVDLEKVLKDRLIFASISHKNMAYTDY